jgi:hypothetical protein
MATGLIAWKLGLSDAELRAAQWPVLRTLLLVLGTAGSVCLLGRFYGLIGVALVWAPYVYFHPQEGLWIAPAFILVASLVSPPAGFEWGVGYSPELLFWAIGVCILFATMSLRYLHGRLAQNRSQLKLIPARGFYAFAVMSVVAAVVGAAHGYALQNVAKQFFGCALLWGYFLFALRFAPTRQQVGQVINRLVYVAVICSVIYFAFFVGLFSIESFSTHLTALAIYGGGLFVLLIPEMFGDKMRPRFNRALLVAAILFAIPVITQFKRVVAACMICGFLAWTMRTKSRRKRYMYLITAFLAFAIMLSTSVLNPIGTWFSQHTGWGTLFPEDVQSHYSIVLRVQEFRQVMDSLGTVPILGSGLGSTVTWYDPLSKVYWDQETVDIGWLYLLAKMGIVGTVAFIWFTFPLGANALRRPISGLHLGLFLLLVFHLLQMVADASFVYFMTAGWEGTTCAFLYIMNKSEGQTRAITPLAV